MKQHDDDVCSICLMILYKPTLLKTCNHAFCAPCINQATDMYEHKKCPLCRTAFKNNDKQLQDQRQAQLEHKYPEEMKSRLANLKEHRFYRIQVGNTTQVLNVQQGNKYRWTLFVKPAPEEQQLAKFVQSVEVKLHPTFNPSKVIFKGDEKVELKRLGWGTFRIDIKIEWVKKFGGFIQVYHDLQFAPHVSKIITCKLGDLNSK